MRIPLVAVKVPHLSAQGLGLARVGHGWNAVGDLVVAHDERLVVHHVVLGGDKEDAVFGREGAGVPLLDADDGVVMGVHFVAKEEDVGVGVFGGQAAGVDHFGGKVVGVGGVEGGSPVLPWLFGHV